MERGGEGGEVIRVFLKSALKKMVALSSLVFIGAMANLVGLSQSNLTPKVFGNQYSALR